jgi:Ankyrin repeat
MAQLCIATLNPDDQEKMRMSHPQTLILLLLGLEAYKSSSGAMECFSDVARPVTEFDRRIIHGDRWKHEMESSFKLAVESGLRLKHESPEGVSLLHEAIYGDHVDLLHFLLASAPKKFAPSIDCQWEDIFDGMAPLHLALLLGRTALVRVLLGHGSDVHLRSKRSQPLSTLFHYASGQILTADLFDELLRGSSSEEDLQGLDAVDVFAFDAAVGSGRFDLATKLLNRSGGAVLEVNLLENLRFLPCGRAIHWW